jgi:hypothetical protein
MNVEDIIQRLDLEWDQPDGFLGRLRAGDFDSPGLERLLNILESIKFEDEQTINRRIVALIWFIPLFMTWQRERVEEHGGDSIELDAAFHRILNAIYAILGVP